MNWLPVEIGTASSRKIAASVALGLGLCTLVLIATSHAQTPSITPSSGASLNLVRPPANPIPPTVETRLNLVGLRLVAYAADGLSVRVGNTKGRFQRLAVSDLAPMGDAEALPPFAVASASHTSDKRWTAAGNWRGLAVVFDSRTTEVVGQCPDDPEKDPTPITAMKLSQDARLLVTGQRSSIVRLHNIKDSTLIWESAPLQQEVSGVDLAPNGKLVAISSGLLKDFNAPGKLVVLDAHTGRMLFERTDMKSKVNHVAFTPDSKLILAADNVTLKVFDAQGRMSKELPIPGVQRLCFVDSQRVIVSRFPGQLCLLDLPAAKIVRTYTGHAKNPEVAESQLIWALDVSPDKKSFASADTHGNVGIWPLD